MYDLKIPERCELTDVFSYLTLVDGAIYETIVALNKKNYKTFASCSGHTCPVYNDTHCFVGIVFPSIREASYFIDSNTETLLKYNTTWIITNKFVCNNQKHQNFQYWDSTIPWETNTKYINEKLKLNYEKAYFVTLEHNDLNLLKQTIVEILENKVTYRTL